MLLLAVSCHVLWAQLTDVPRGDWSTGGEGRCRGGTVRVVPWGCGGAAMSRRNGPAGAELNAEREKIRREIEELERSLRLDVTGGDVAVSDSSLSSGTRGAALPAGPAGGRGSIGPFGASRRRALLLCRASARCCCRAARRAWFTLS